VAGVEGPRVFGGGCWTLPLQERGAACMRCIVGELFDPPDISALCVRCLGNQAQHSHLVLCVICSAPCGGQSDQCGGGKGFLSRPRTAIPVGWFLNELSLAHFLQEVQHKCQACLDQTVLHRVHCI